MMGSSKPNSIVGIRVGAPWYSPSQDGYAPNAYTILGQTNQAFSAIKTGINQLNELKVVVNVNSFSFYINGTPLQDTIAPDTSLTGGQLALLVSGTSATFAASQVTLTTP